MNYLGVIRSPNDGLISSHIVKQRKGESRESAIKRYFRSVLTEHFATREMCEEDLNTEDWDLEVFELIDDPKVVKRLLNVEWPETYVDADTTSQECHKEAVYRAFAK